MATRVRIANSDGRAQSSGLSLPVTRGLKFWHFLDGATEAVRNRADGQPAGTITGSPTWSSGYGTFSGNTTYVSTGIADLNLTNVSIIAMVKSAAAFSGGSSRPQFVGSYGAIGSDLYAACINVTGTPSSAPAATVAVSASRNNGGVPAVQTASITVADMSKWTILGMSVAGAGGTGALKIYDLTNNVQGSGDLATARLPHPTRLFQIGATSSSLIGGDVKCYGAGGFDAILTLQEFQRLAAGIRRRALAFHNITEGT